MKKTGILLINLGTPDSPSVSDVRKYLSQFLNDERVIDINWLARKLLVNLVIVPFRASKSAKIYKKLWTPNGSPLLLHSIAVKNKLQQELGEEYLVELAMRYQNPSIESVLAKMKKMHLSKIIVLPLFPHYASSSTGSALQRVMEVVSKWWVIPEITMISQYFNHQGFIDAFVARGQQYNISEYDHVLFSYHGLPERQVDKVYEDRKCSNHHCEDEMNAENEYCYKATCYETTRLLTSRLNITKEKYSVAFQSRLDDKWLKPYSDKVIEDLAKKGHKKVLVFSPAFTADCLETTIEIGHEYQEIFEKHGGEKVQLVESLNSHPLWIDALKQMVVERN